MGIAISSGGVFHHECECCGATVRNKDRERPDGWVGGLFNGHISYICDLCQQDFNCTEFVTVPKKRNWRW